MSDTLTGVKAGSVITARASDTNNLVWFYVIAPLPNGKVFGVNVGTNAGYVSPDGPNGYRFDTATAEHYGEVDTLARFSGEVAGALVSFLVAAGLKDPREESTEAPTAPSAEALAEEYRRGVREAQERHQRFLDSLVSDAHEWADSNSLCGEFDRFMDEHGLPGRTRPYRVTLDVQTSVTIYVDASSEEEAADLATDMFQNDPLSYATDLDVDVSDVERD